MPVAAVAGSVAAAAIGASAQSKAAKKSANAISDASAEATALEREIYYDQRDLLAPSITAGASARARQMLMMGYSPEEVKAYLRSTEQSLRYDDGANGASAGGSEYAPTGGLLDPARSLLSGGATPSTGGGGAGGPAPATGNYDWVDNWDWQASSPSYQWRFDQGQKALERSKAASGDFFSGDTAIALTEYGQNAGAQEWEADWRRLGQLSGDGTDATGTTVQVAGNFGAGAAQNTMAAGQARASGYQQSGNSWGNFWQGAAGVPMYAYGQGWFGGK